MERKADSLFAGRYLLIKELGVGGFSEVWLAQDTATQLQVALKIYAPGAGMDNECLDLFTQEFALVFNLNHSNLLRPTYYDTYERMPYLVMPFCEKGAASRLIGKATEEQLWQFIHDVAAALAYLHTQDPPVIHQDIKPANILIDNADRFLLTDFGISTKIRTTLRKSLPRSADYSSAGTPQYMAPERFSKDPSPIMANDIWSLGATLFELITGETPFKEMGGLAQKNGADIPHFPKNTPYSKELQHLITKCLDSKPWQRPTAADLKKGRGKWLEKKGKKGIIWIILVAIVLGIAGVGVLWHRQRTPQPQNSTLLLPNNDADTLLEVIPDTLFTLPPE